MRATLILIVFTVLLGLFFWTTLSGALFGVAFLFWMIFVIISWGYSDKAILFYMGAREVRSHDKAIFFEAATQEAYKLSVPAPDLYFYNGSLDRGFILQNGKSLSLVLSKSLLENSHESELSVICFELLLQAKKKMASKRTRVMFMLGSLNWISHAGLSLVTKLIPSKNFAKSSDWLLNFFLLPWIDLLFKISLGAGYFAKLKAHIHDFPSEEEGIVKLGLKLKRPVELYSLSTRKMMEFSASGKSRHYQNIIALEFLPHEWDFFFDEGLTRA